MARLRRVNSVPRAPGPRVRENCALRGNRPCVPHPQSRRPILIIQRRHLRRFHPEASPGIQTRPTRRAPPHRLSHQANNLHLGPRLAPPRGNKAGPRRHGLSFSRPPHEKRRPVSSLEVLPCPAAPLEGHVPGISRRDFAAMDIMHSERRGQLRTAPVPPQVSRGNRAGARGRAVAA